MLPYINVFGRAIPAYGLCMALGIMLAAALALCRAKRAGVNENSIIIVMASAVGFALIGAKLLYIFASYGLVKALREIATGDFSALTGGGLVFYGGLIFGAFGAFTASQLLHEESEKLTAISVPVIPLGHACGRVGCFLAGCCYGLPYAGDFGIKVISGGTEYTLFPIQLVEAALNIVLFAVLIHMSRKLNGYKLLSTYLAIYAVMRYILEYFRGDKIRGYGMGLTTSQWISAAILLASAAYLLVCCCADTQKS